MRFPSILLSIKELASNEKWLQVFSHYQEIKRAGVQLTDPSVFPSILKACSILSFGHGKSMHASLIKQGFDLFTSIGNSIVDLYMKCGDLACALSVFDCMKNTDSVSWNIMVHGYLDQGALGEGLCCFTNARVAGFEPNTSTLVLVIHACRSLKLNHGGPMLHGYLIRSGFWAIPSVQNSLLCIYADGDMKFARNMFDETCNREVISWSVMIGGYVRSGEARFGLELFREMVLEGRVEPDGVNVVSVLKACADLGDVSIGKSVHGLVICRGLDNCDVFVGNSLIDMYSKCIDSDSAFKVFDQMPAKNVVSWNSILSGFVLNGNHSEALSLLYLMGKGGIKADVVTLVNVLQTCKHFVNPFQCKSVHCVIIRQGYELNELALNSLIDAYAKCNLVELAWKIFDKMERRDVVSWSTMIAGFAYCGMPDEATAVFQEMSKTQEKPNAVTIINLLEACSVSAEMRRSKWGHGIAIRRGLAEEAAVGTAIVDMYSKCGDIEESRKAFVCISKKNIVSWSAMIAAYGMNGLAHEALTLLAEMKLHGLNPNAVTTLSALSACSHGGLVEEGISFFKSMAQDYGIEPGLEHYSCAVDMLSRAGKLDSAMDLIKKMPKGLEASASLWGALLSACRSYGNRELGEGAVSHVLELEPLNPAGYLLASNMYAAGGLWVDAAKMRRWAKEKGVRVVAGYSLVHVGGKAFKFVAGNESHPGAAGEIHFIVQHLHCCMKIDMDFIEF